MKRILITGTTGQDGGYLTEPPLALGYGVLGFVRRATTDNADRIDHVDLD